LKIGNEDFTRRKRLRAANPIRPSLAVVKKKKKKGGDQEPKKKRQKISPLKYK